MYDEGLCSKIIALVIKEAFGLKVDFNLKNIEHKFKFVNGKFYPQDGGYIIDMCSILYKMLLGKISEASIIEEFVDSIKYENGKETINVLDKCKTFDESKNKDGKNFDYCDILYNTITEISLNNDNIKILEHLHKSNIKLPQIYIDKIMISEKLNCINYTSSPDEYLNKNIENGKENIKEIKIPGPKKLTLNLKTIPRPGNDHFQTKKGRAVSIKIINSKFPTKIVAH